MPNEQAEQQHSKGLIVPCGAIHKRLHMSAYELNGSETGCNRDCAGVSYIVFCAAAGTKMTSCTGNYYQRRAYRLRTCHTACPSHI